jgi:hypothetical protein
MQVQLAIVAFAAIEQGCCNQFDSANKLIRFEIKRDAS